MRVMVTVHHLLDLADFASVFAANHQFVIGGKGQVSSEITIPCHVLNVGRRRHDRVWFERNIVRVSEPVANKVFNKFVPTLHIPQNLSLKCVALSSNLLCIAQADL